MNLTRPWVAMDLDRAGLGSPGVDPARLMKKVGSGSAVIIHPQPTIVISPVSEHLIVTGLRPSWYPAHLLQARPQVALGFWPGSAQENQPHPGIAMDLDRAESSLPGVS